MGGTAPANQLRLSFAGSEDGEAETETCRAAKTLWRMTTRTSRPVRAQFTEPPYADPHVRWCGRGEWATTPPMPISLGVFLVRCESGRCPQGLKAPCSLDGFAAQLSLAKKHSY